MNKMTEHRQTRISEFDESGMDSPYYRGLRAGFKKMLKWIGHDPPYTMREINQARKEFNMDA